MRRVALAFVPGLLRRNPLGLARLVHSANAVRLGGKRSSGRSGGDTAPDGACGGHANATQHTIQPSGLRRRWRWELSYRRITALFDLRGRKDAVTGWERRYRERRAPRRVAAEKTVTRAGRFRACQRKALSRCGTRTFKHVHLAPSLQVIQRSQSKAQR